MSHAEGLPTELDPRRATSPAAKGWDLPPPPRQLKSHQLSSNTAHPESFLQLLQTLLRCFCVPFVDEGRKLTHNPQQPRSPPAPLSRHLFSASWCTHPRTIFCSSTQAPQWPCRQLGTAGAPGAPQPRSHPSCDPGTPPAPRLSCKQRLLRQEPEDPKEMPIPAGCLSVCNDSFFLLY